VTDKSVATEQGLGQLSREPAGPTKKKRAKKLVEEPEFGEGK